MIARLVQFTVLLAFWLGLSARLSPLFVGMGAVAAAATTWMTGPIVADVLGPPLGGARTALVRGWRAVVFVAWLLSRIPPAVLQIAQVVLDPRLSADPHVLTFSTSLRSPVARALLANSISLTPGTITLAVGDDGTFVVHTFVRESADDLVSGVMQNRVGKLFLYPPQAPPDVRWEADTPSPKDTP